MSANVRITLFPVLLMTKDRSIVPGRRIWTDNHAVFVVEDPYDEDIVLEKEDFLFFGKTEGVRYYTVYSLEGVPSEYSMFTGAPTLSKDASKENVVVTVGEPFTNGASLTDEEITLLSQDDEAAQFHESLLKGDACTDEGVAIADPEFSKETSGDVIRAMLKHGPGDYGSNFNFEGETRRGRPCYMRELSEADEIKIFGCTRDSLRRIDIHGNEIPFDKHKKLVYGMSPARAKYLAGYGIGDPGPIQDRDDPANDPRIRVGFDTVFALGHLGIRRAAD